MVNQRRAGRTVSVQKKQRLLRNPASAKGQTTPECGAPRSEFRLRHSLLRGRVLDGREEDGDVLDLAHAHLPLTHAF
jgi:hypothetical protein